MHLLYYHNKSWNVDVCNLLVCENSVIYVSEFNDYKFIFLLMYISVADFCDILLAYVRQI